MRPSSSHLFEGANVEYGFFVPRDHRSIFSKCWIREKLMEDGTWLILEGVDFGRPISQPVESRRPKRPYVDDFAPFSSDGSTVYRSPAPQSEPSKSFHDTESIEPNVQDTGFDQDQQSDSFSSSEQLDFHVNSLDDEKTSTDQFVFLVSSDGSTVYRSPAPQSEPSKSFHDTESTEPNVQDTGFDQDQQSDSFSSSEQLDFHVNSLDDEKTSTDQFVFVADTPAVGTAPSPTQTSLPPPVTTDVSASFAELRASISRLIANHTRDYRDQAFRVLIKIIRQEAHNGADVFSMKLEAARTQNAILRTELADVRQEVKAQKAELFKEIDQRLATIRSEQLDFRAQAQESYNTLSTQLGFLVDYINRGGDSKRVKVVATTLNRLLMIRIDPVGEVPADVVVLVEVVEEMIEGIIQRKGDPAVVVVDRVLAVNLMDLYKKDAEYWLFGNNQF
ncbi:bZIP transcription factor 3 family protein [Dorcoceras hygrometricum]|uniref:BZIP transcription factor 3 family protein n=1 Tax=Dorcoceras hygrometricum TaxID=472368 RepID=A0A2Z7CSH0_9LAMI|nr:bZIP transcription factor 3 family protein [Dorcoceras hygrometricum]